MAGAGAGASAGGRGVWGDGSVPGSDPKPQGLVTGSCGDGTIPQILQINRDTGVK